MANSYASWKLIFKALKRIHIQPLPDDMLSQEELSKDIQDQHDDVVKIFDGKLAVDLSIFHPSNLYKNYATNTYTVFYELQILLKYS